MKKVKSKFESLNEKKFQAIEKSKMNKVFGGMCTKTIVGTATSEGQPWAFDGYTNDPCGGSGGAF
ncbi:MAG TPA: hypothetical protein VFL70_02770 [Bacteroidia bacterium]|nr:hypothetical protein [Bacteroidia bacterium]